MQHEERSEQDATGDKPRRIRGGDGRHDPADSDEAEPGGAVQEDNAGVDGGADDEDGQLPQGDIFAIAQSYKGPLPPASMLGEYDGVVPGSANGIVSAHLEQRRVSSAAIERLTRAESIAVTTGAIGAQVLTIGGLVAAVILVIAGYPAGAIAAIPAIIGASAQVVAALRKK